MSRKVPLGVFSAIAAVCLAAAASFAQGPETRLQVIGFVDTLVLEVGGRPVRLEPGSMGYGLGPGVQTKVVRGEGLFLVEGTTLKADVGDSLVGGSKH